MKKKPGIIIVMFMLGVLAVASFSQPAPVNHSFRLPHYETFLLDNGLTVYLMEQHEVPLIYISAVFPAGAEWDNGRYGLAALTAKGLLLGTKNDTKQQVEEKLDFLGVSYSARAGLETAVIAMSFLNTQQDSVFPILRDLITQPVFEPTEFDKYKKRLLLELEQEKEIPARVIDDYYRKFLFGSHGYGNPVSGTRPAVEKIAVDDLKAFYKANYYPRGSAIAIVGDFKTPAMTKRVERLFSSWQVDAVPQSLHEQPLPVVDRPRVLLVDKADAGETRFMLGGLGMKRNNPDYIAVELVNTVLGGRFTSWLNDKLRVEAGLTYGAISYFSRYRSSGTFVISSFTRTASTVEAIDLALQVLARLHREGIDQKTLASAKNYLKGQFPPRYETSGRLASLLTAMFYYHFDESFINGFQESVDGISQEKTKEIISRYFPAANLQFVFLGNASAIRDHIKKYGEVIEKEIKADGF
jgi:zinc protease